MGKLFCNLVDNNLINEWADTLDWIFDEEKFSETYGWNKNYIRVFTKRVKTLKPFVKFTYDYIKNLIYPSEKDFSQQIVISKRDSQGRDIVRHIRNGIAHGKTYCFNSRKELYIKIFDYNSSGTQTAFICFPIHTIIDIYKIYEEINKSINNNKFRGRKKKYKTYSKI